MKKLLLLLIFISFELFAGTCSSISRTDYGTRDILTSTSLNTQLNAAYSSINTADGGCIVDGTLEKGSLNTTDFDVVLNSNRTGCQLEYVSGATLSVGYCYIAVNGNYVSTTSTTNLDFTNLDTGSETASTDYYVYVKDGSTGSTLTPEISLTAPNGNGYNVDGDRVIGSFRNNNDSNIATYSIYQWIDGNHNARQVTESAFISTVYNSVTYQYGGMINEKSCTVSGSDFSCTFEQNYWLDTPICQISADNGGIGQLTSTIRVQGSEAPAGLGTVNSLAGGSYSVITQLPATPTYGWHITCTGILKR